MLMKDMVMHMMKKVMLMKNMVMHMMKKVMLMKNMVMHMMKKVMLMKIMVIAMKSMDTITDMMNMNQKKRKRCMMKEKSTLRNNWKVNILFVFKIINAKKIT